MVSLRLTARRPFGFGLLELLVALFLNAVVLGALQVVLKTSSQSQRFLAQRDEAQQLYGTVQTALADRDVCTSAIVAGAELTFDPAATTEIPIAFRFPCSAEPYAEEGTVMENRIRIEKLRLTGFAAVDSTLGKYTADLVAQVGRVGHSGGGPERFLGRVFKVFLTTEPVPGTGLRKITSCHGALADGAEAVCAKLGGIWLTQPPQIAPGRDGNCAFGNPIFLSRYQAIDFAKYPEFVPLQCLWRPAGVTGSRTRVYACIQRQRYRGWKCTFDPSDGWQVRYLKGPADPGRLALRCVDGLSVGRPDGVVHLGYLGSDFDVTAELIGAPDGTPLTLWQKIDATVGTLQEGGPVSDSRSIYLPCADQRAVERGIGSCVYVTDTDQSKTFLWNQGRAALYNTQFADPGLPAGAEVSGAPVDLKHYSGWLHVLVPGGLKKVCAAGACGMEILQPKGIPLYWVTARPGHAESLAAPSTTLPSSALSEEDLSQVIQCVYSPVALLPSLHQLHRGNIDIRRCDQTRGVSSEDVIARPPADPDESKIHPGLCYYVKRIRLPSSYRKLTGSDPYYDGWVQLVGRPTSEQLAKLKTLPQDGALTYTTPYLSSLPAGTPPFSLPAHPCNVGVRRSAQ